MTDPVTLEDVRDGLLAEGLITDQVLADKIIAQLREIPPWYIRVMVGLGAWLASLLLIGFVAGISFIAEGGSMVTGLIMIGGAVYVRRNNDSDFLVQSAIAVCLAGQALFTFGIAELSGHEEFELTMLLVIITSSALFVVFPDRIHRVLMVLIATSSAATLLYVWEWKIVIPVLGPALAGAMVFLHRSRLADGVGSPIPGDMLRPLMNGLMLAAFGCLMLSTIYVLPELIDDFVFYPHPWISTLILGGLLLFTAVRTVESLFHGNQTAAAVACGLLVTVIIAAWFAPGLILALLVILLGASVGSVAYMGTGIGFLAVFLGAFFYGVDLSMMQKAMTLVGAGLAILFMRRVVLTLLPTAFFRESGS